MYIHNQRRCIQHCSEIPFSVANMFGWMIILLSWECWHFWGRNMHMLRMDLSFIELCSQSCANASIIQCGRNELKITYFNCASISSCVCLGFQHFFCGVCEFFLSICICCLGPFFVLLFYSSKEYWIVFSLSADI